MFPLALRKINMLKPDPLQEKNIKIEKYLFYSYVNISNYDLFKLLFFLYTVRSRALINIYYRYFGSRGLSFGEGAEYTQLNETRLRLREFYLVDLSD